jgi:hypothetical protein
LRAANFQIQNRPFERRLSGLRNAVAKPALLDVKLTPHSPHTHSKTKTVFTRSRSCAAGRAWPWARLGSGRRLRDLR